MRRVTKLLLLTVFAVLLALPIGNTGNMTLTNDALRDDGSNSIQIEDSGVQVAGIQDIASWWNSTYIYRYYFNFTENDGIDRTLSPVHVYLTFTDGHCYSDSIRVGFYTGDDWTMLPFQTWNTTFYPSSDFVQSTRVSFMVNVSANTAAQDYYVYYAKIDVGSVSYPDFYPFIYKSYTYSLINLVSYYDGNNYYVEKWDSSISQWDDPRNFDLRWSAGQVTPYDTPNGTLNRFGNVRYEPTAYSNTPGYFWGYYTVHSNYPLAISMGQGNIGSNSAVNDWYHTVSEVSLGTGTSFILGGVEGFESRNEGKYWVQAVQDNTEVYVWTSSDTADTGWLFHNGSSVDSWPAVLNAGEYVSKRDVLYTYYMYVNSTKPVSAQQGDSDATYARDIWTFYSSIDGGLAGEEFYTIDMGNAYDYTRVTNLGNTAIDVDWQRNAGSGWSTWTTISINANSSQLIARGTASISNQEDVLHIKAESGSMIIVEGLYNPTVAIDAGDWVPTTTGDRFGTTHKLWGISGYKFFITATENAEIEVSGYNSGTIYLSAGEVSEFRPVSGSISMYHINSNVSVGVLDVGKFSTSSPYAPTGDTGSGWTVPAYTPESDQNGLQIDISTERNLFEVDITVVDLDGQAVEGAFVALYNTTGPLWLDAQNNNRSGLTDENGLIIFEGLFNGSYEVRTQIDGADWLLPSGSGASVWITEASVYDVTDSVTPVSITLNMASVYIHLEDLMGDSMDDTLDEDIYMRLCNDSNDDSIYVHQAQANATGWLEFPRVPQDDYYFRARYAGENAWNTYGFDNLKEFANWTISSSDFASGSIERNNWILPLVTMQLHIHSWDDKAVPNAFIELNNTVDELSYTMTVQSDSNGNFTLTRIVNGTWQLNVWRYDDFSTKIFNNTNEAVLSNIQDYREFEVQLRLTILHINIRTSSEANVPDATVTVYLNNLTAIAYGQTDSSGNIMFEWIHGNMTTPYTIWYTVDVVKGTGEVIRYTVKADSDYAYSNIIYLPDPTYSSGYTTLTSTYSFEQQYWYGNYSFAFDYFNRTGNEANFIDDNLTSVENIFFFIYSGETLIGTGSWISGTSLFIEQTPNPSTFTIIIDLLYWKLNSSDTAYKIIINATTSGYNNPDSLVVYLTVLQGETSYGSSTSGITGYYGSHGEYLFWLSDTTNGGNLTTLDVYNYSIKLGLDVLKSGYLYDNGNGTFSLLPEYLSGFSVGDYVLVITLDKLNYDGVVTELQVTVEAVPMQITAISVFDYTWSLSTREYYFEFVFDLPGNSSNPDLSGVTVIIEWFSLPGGVSYLNVTEILSASSGTFTYSFQRNLLPVGSWDITITCAIDNYASAVGTVGSSITVSDAPTTLSITTPDTIQVNWLETAVFEFDFSRDDDGYGLAGVSYTHNWTGAIVFENLGSGIYRVTLDTSIEASTYGFEITFSYANHADKTAEMEVEILIPLLIETAYGSIENPLQAYWTQRFLIEITLYDQSRGSTVINGATVSYDWYVEFVVNLDGDLDDYIGGIYNISLDAADAVPSDDLYSVIITATYPGATLTEITIFVHISAVPNEVVLDVEFFEQYYADIFDVRFYWNNTLDGAPIDTYDSAEYYLVTLGTNILTGVNEGGGWYHFTVDSVTLDMNAQEQGSVYVIQIIMTRSGFSAHTFTAVIILVQETDASLEIDSIVDTYWSDYVVITANLYDALHGGYIWIGADITISYGTYSILMDNHLNGTFTASFLAKDWFAARDDSYGFTFTYTMPNFVDSTNTSSVIISPIDGALIMDSHPSPSYSYIWSEEFNLIVRVYEVDTPTTFLLDNEVYYLWSGYSTLYRLDYQILDFNYRISVDTVDVPAGSYDLIIHVVNENYTVADRLITIEINTVGTSLTADSLEYDVLADATGLSITLEFVIDDDGVSLTNTLSTASVWMEYAGTIYTATYQSGTGFFRLTFNPSEIDIRYIPGEIVLNITASLLNYTTQQINPILRLTGPTTLSGPAVLTEDTLTVRIYFQFMSTMTGEPLGPDDVSSITLTTQVETFTKEDFEFNGTHFYIDLSSEQIGPVQAEPYDLLLTATAEGYEGQIEQVIQVTVSELTYDVLGLGFVRVPMSLLNVIILMSGLFLLFGSLAVSYQRWKVPYAIKQINKATKQMQDGKTARIANIKTMGTIVSELLAPGLADLDIVAPTIEAAPEVDIELLGTDTEGLLDGLDALDDIGVDDEESLDDATDYEAELTAELDTIIEEEPEPEVVESYPEDGSDIDPIIEVESDSEPEIEEPPIELDAEDVEETGSEAEDTVDEVIPEPEIESDVVAEDIVKGSGADIEVEPEYSVTAEDLETMAEKLFALGRNEDEVTLIVENAKGLTKSELDALLLAIQKEQHDMNEEPETENASESAEVTPDESESTSEDMVSIDDSEVELEDSELDDEDFDE